ncbi:hypothetical protein ACFV04_02905, partial [Kitasatospora sp. NPDC059599]
MGSFARALEDFFTRNGLALPTDQADKLAAGRRRRPHQGRGAQQGPARGAGDHDPRAGHRPGPRGGDHRR